MLTAKEKTVLLYLINFITKKQYTPTITDLSRELLVDQALVHRYLESLADKGFIDRTKKTNKSVYATIIRVLRLPDGTKVRLTFVPLDDGN